MAYRVETQDPYIRVALACFEVPLTRGVARLTPGTEEHPIFEVVPEDLPENERRVLDAFEDLAHQLVRDCHASCIINVLSRLNSAKSAAREAVRQEA